jgi:hypothetical protein
MESRSLHQLMKYQEQRSPELQPLEVQLEVQQSEGQYQLEALQQRVEQLEPQQLVEPPVLGEPELPAGQQVPLPLELQQLAHQNLNR